MTYESYKSVTNSKMTVVVANSADAVEPYSFKTTLRYSQAFVVFDVKKKIHTAAVWHSGKILPARQTDTSGESCSHLHKRRSH